MKRYRKTVRADWIKKVEEAGLTYHTHESTPYWDESVFYEFTASEVDTLEAAANDLHERYLEAVQAVIDNSWFARLAIPPAAVNPVVDSWNNDDPSIYGRFDFAWDEGGIPKLLEYNADTPTALVEASVIQWFWLEECFKEGDQFNSIHERLIEAWKQHAAGPVYFASLKDFPEDEQTVTYMCDTCHQAGVETALINIEDLGWDEPSKSFVDMEGRQIRCCFKLYPWEWMWHEEFSKHLPKRVIRFVEPAWKTLLSNKGMLPILWELFPDHPNLVPSFETPERFAGSFVRKPKLGREGNNIKIVEDGIVVAETQGDYGDDGFVFQSIIRGEAFDGFRPIAGVWIINHEAAGLGIREDEKRIVTNLSRFVPHMFKPELS